MATVEPVPGEPAAVVTVGAVEAEAGSDGGSETVYEPSVAGIGERALVVADYHAGFEAALRSEGVELRNRAADRREHLLALLDETAPDRVVFLGDLAHWIGRPEWGERDELLALVEAVTERVPATLVKGNHDGELEDAIPIPVSDSRGLRIGDVGFAHGHTWPSAAVLAADVVCVGHEHPTVRLEDAVGGRRIERVWLRGRLDGRAFEGHVELADRDGALDAVARRDGGDAGDAAVDDARDDAGGRVDEAGGDGEADGGAERAFLAGVDGELVVFPAFNALVGGTWVNVEGQDFLAPFLPEGMVDGEAFLLDGTRLGAYRSI